MQLVGGVDLGAYQVHPSLSLGMDQMARILVVDDESEILDFLQQALTVAGCEVDVASTAGDALKLILDAAYDAAILDFNLPDMDGVMLHRAIRQMNPELAGRTIFMSGLIQPENDLSYYARQDAPFLLKPFHLRDVLAAIRWVRGDVD